MHVPCCTSVWNRLSHSERGARALPSGRKADYRKQSATVPRSPGPTTRRARQRRVAGHGGWQQFGLRLTTPVTVAPADGIFSQRLGQLRATNANALAGFDLGAHTGDRPVAPIGHGLLQKRRDHTQGGLALPRGRPGATLAFNALRRHRPKSRCATGEPCPRAHRTPRQSWDWSSRPASAARCGRGPLPRDHASRPV